MHAKSIITKEFFHIKYIYIFNYKKIIFKLEITIFSCVRHALNFDISFWEKNRKKKKKIAENHIKQFLLFSNLIVSTNILQFLQHR